MSALAQCQSESSEYEDHVNRMSDNNQSKDDDNLIVSHDLNKTTLILSVN